VTYFASLWGSNLQLIAEQQIMNENYWSQYKFGMGNLWWDRL